MATNPTQPPPNGVSAQAAGLLPLAELHEHIRRGSNDDANLFALFAALARQAGRDDLAAELDRRARGHKRLACEPPAEGLTSEPLVATGGRPPSPQTAALLNQGLRLATEGKLDEAAARFRQAIQQSPDCADAYGNLGVVLARLRRVAEAEAAFRLCLQLAPTGAVMYLNLATAVQEQDRPVEAEGWVRQSLLLQPDAAAAHRLLGNALEKQRKYEPAEAAFREALRLKPDFADVHFRLGGVLKRLGKPQEAEAAYREAIRLAPDQPDHWNNLGILLETLERPTEVEACYREALRLKPDSAEFNNNLGVALAALDRHEESEGYDRETLRLKPDFAAAHSNLGNTLRTLCRLKEAAESLRNALRLHPNYAEAHNNLGIVLAHDGLVAEGIRHYDEALRLRKDYPEAHMNRSLASLAQADFVRGWPEYEYRFKMPRMKPPEFKAPRWDGSPLGSRTLLLCAEQGLGDTVQFVRYAALVRGTEGKVILDCPPPLVELLATCPGVDQIIPRGEPLPPFDVHLPLLSVPGLVGTNLDNIPASIPYVRAEPGRVEFWRQELSGVEGFRVGIAWQGSKQHRGDRNRSVRLCRFAPLATVHGVRLLSLQKGHGTEQLAEAAAAGWEVLDYGARIGPSFADTAALLLNLDLVVTVDTAVAHVAGALGVPVWIATGYSPDWRWLRGRDDTPWYPSMRFFRQPAATDWATVFARIAAALAEAVAAKQQRGRPADGLLPAAPPP